MLIQQNILLRNNTIQETTDSSSLFFQTQQTMTFCYHLGNHGEISNSWLHFHQINTLPILNHSPYDLEQRLLPRASPRMDQNSCSIGTTYTKSYISCKQASLISIELPKDTSHLDYISQSTVLPTTKKQLQIGHHQVGTPPFVSGNLLYVQCTRLHWTEQKLPLVATSSTPNVSKLDIQTPFPSAQVIRPSDISSKL